MIDREKVINGLNHCFHGQECCGDTECPYYIEHLSDSCCLEDCQENLKIDALALLKEQKAVEPFHKCIGKDFILIEDSHFDYCPYCGNPILWEGR